MKTAPQGRIMSASVVPVKPRPKRSCRLCRSSTHDARRCPDRDQLLEQGRAAATALGVGRAAVARILAELPPREWPTLLSSAAAAAAVLAAEGDADPGEVRSALSEVRRLSRDLAAVERLSSSRPRAWLSPKARA